MSKDYRASGKVQGQNVTGQNMKISVIDIKNKPNKPQGEGLIILKTAGELPNQGSWIRAVRNAG